MDFYFQTCNSNECPVWTEWSSWTACSVSCGGGERQRQRRCLLPDGTSRTDLFCPGPKLETEPCNDGPEYKCPELGPWSDWSECSLSCGGGRRLRSRQCGIAPERALNLYQHNNPCLKPLNQEEMCNPQSCPMLTEWSDWTQCSASCGGGFRRKNRECVENEVESIIRRGRQLDSFLDNPCKQVCSR